jgi:hypothetical protein
MTKFPSCRDHSHNLRWIGLHPRTNKFRAPVIQVDRPELNLMLTVIQTLESAVEIYHVHDVRRCRPLRHRAARRFLPKCCAGVQVSFSCPNSKSFKNSRSATLPAARATSCDLNGPSRIRAASGSPWRQISQSERTYFLCVQCGLHNSLARDSGLTRVGYRRKAGHQGGVRRSPGPLEPGDRPLVRVIRQKQVARGEQYGCDNGRPEPVPQDQDVADQRCEECDGREPGNFGPIHGF